MERRSSPQSNFNGCNLKLVKLFGLVWMDNRRFWKSTNMRDQQVAECYINVEKILLFYLFQIK